MRVLSKKIKEKPKIVAKPSKPIDKEKKAEKQKLTNAKIQAVSVLLENTVVPVEAHITAGTWVAEIDNANIRKNSLRLGR